MGATSSFSHILVQEEEQQRQLAAIVDGYRVGGLDSGALLRMAKDANQQHQLFGGATEEAQRWTETPSSTMRCAQRWKPVVHTGNTTGASGHVSTRSEEHTSELQSLMRISYAV